MHGRQVRAQRVEVVQRRAGNLGGARRDLLVAQRIGRGRKVAVPVVGPVDSHRAENACQRADLAHEILRCEAALAELLWQGVRRRGHRHPARDQFGQQPRDQRGVARVVQLELVDAHHDIVGQQIDALDEAEYPGQLGQLAERRECLSAPGTC